MCGICGYMQKEKITSNDTIISIKDSILKRNWLELDDYERKNQLDININNYNNFTDDWARKLETLVESSSWYRII